MIVMSIELYSSSTSYRFTTTILLDKIGVAEAHATRIPLTVHWGSPYQSEEALLKNYVIKLHYLMTDDIALCQIILLN